MPVLQGLEEIRDRRAPQSHQVHHDSDTGFFQGDRVLNLPQAI